MSLIEISKDYFNLFSQKNLKKLSDLFSDDIVLQDWDNFATGKSKVIETNNKIFQSVDTINVKISKIYNDKNVVIAELEIVINNHENLTVVDIISFDNDQKIKSIRAYKG